MEIRPQLIHTAHRILADFNKIPIKMYNNGYKDVIQFTMDTEQYNAILNLLEEVDKIGEYASEYRRVRIE